MAQDRKPAKTGEGLFGLLLGFLLSVLALKRRTSRKRRRRRYRYREERLPVALMTPPDDRGRSARIPPT